jgi:formylglycine-generating enzyme
MWISTGPDTEQGLGYTGDKEKPIEQRGSFTWRDWGVDQSDESPVVNVSHNDAVAFYDWLSKKEGKTYRLPTEAEWEYACRAGTTIFSNGNDADALTRIGNVADATAKEKFPNWSTVSTPDGWAFTAPVGQFAANNFGVYDMTGNVWEWCSHWFDKKYYRSSPVADPSGPQTDSLGVLRGGGWDNSAGGCRSALRLKQTPGFRHYSLGFRLAAVPSGK